MGGSEAAIAPKSRGAAKLRSARAADTLATPRLGYAYAVLRITDKKYPC